MTPEARLGKRAKLIAEGKIPNQPIQWQRLSSALDICPRCETPDIWYEKRTRRWCPKCDLVFRPFRKD